MARMPVVFVSHGSPELAVQQTPTHCFLRELGDRLPKPIEILVMSAHWETAAPTVATNPKPETIYDFSGFDPRLRQMTYEAPRAEALSHRTTELLEKGGFAPVVRSSWGYDHGVWVPLCLIYPKAVFAIAQISIQPAQSPEHHFALGRALAPLRDDGVLIVASGGLTHNLAAFRGQPVDAEAQSWVVEFNDWLHERLVTGDANTLLDYRTKAPHAVRNHPTDGHLLPLFVALGAATGEPATRLHASYEHGILAMDAYGFGMAVGGPA